MSYYDIIRFYRDRPIKTRVIKRHVSLEEAQTHCKDPETSSFTAKNKIGVVRTQRMGAWFDGYRESLGLK